VAAAIARGSSPGAVAEAVASRADADGVTDTDANTLPPIRGVCG